MKATIHINVSESLCIRDPQDTELGRKIIDNSIYLIDEIGFEDFTFKKLATKIESTEASVYRYFESKHQLLLYLVSWYWNWIYYRINFNTQNIKNAKEKLRIVLKILTESTSDDPASTFVNEAVLYRIVVAESAKAYLTTKLKTYDHQALFESFHQLTEMFAKLLKEINPKYRFPKALACSLITMAHRQTFFAHFLPNLTELKVKRNDPQQIINFLEKVALSTLQ